MRIGSADTRSQVVVVAEIGNNHEGDVELASRLVALAADCGADAVKVQSFRTADFVSPSETERFARLRRFELTPGEFERLATEAHRRGLAFVVTPLDLGTVDDLAPVVDAFKIASSDITFYPLIERIVATGKPMVLSTGLSDLAETQRAVEMIGRQLAGGRSLADSLAVLHCVTAYPVPDGEVNLNAIGALRRALGVEVGYSDHAVGIEAAVLAVAAGATIIEKHFTIDHHHSDFRDHQLSADPEELRELTRRVRAAATMLGSRAKAVQPSAAAGVVTLRRSISAARDLPPGHVLAWADLRWLRPGGGLPPGEEAALLGRRLRRAVAAGERLLPEDVG